MSENPPMANYSDAQRRPATAGTPSPSYAAAQHEDEYRPFPPEPSSDIPQRTQVLPNQQQSMFDFSSPFVPLRDADAALTATKDLLAAAAKKLYRSLGSRSDFGDESDEDPRHILRRASPVPSDWEERGDGEEKVNGSPRESFLAQTTAVGSSPASRDRGELTLDNSGGDPAPGQLPNHSEPKPNVVSLPAEVSSFSQLEPTRDAEPDVPGFYVNDFSGGQVHVPFASCRSWAGLAEFLGKQLKIQNGTDFITSGSFGLLAPEESELLSNDTWRSWVLQRKPDMTLDLYAVIADDSDRCPKCFSPVTHPGPNSLQRCAVVECQFTFLVVYRETDFTRLAESLCPFGSPDQSEFPSESLQNRTPANSPASVISSAVQPFSVPDRVQVIRRRPFRADPEDPPPASPSTVQITASAPEPRKLATSYTKLVHNVYIFLFLGLPDRYCQEAPRDGEGITRNPCQRWIKEWTYIGTTALAICGLLAAVLQISSGGDDPIVHTLAVLSLVCLSAGAAYAALLVMTFGKLETEAERRGWIRAACKMLNNCFWTPWILLAMPLAWISWGIFYAVLLIGAFILRDGATNEPDPNSRLSPHQAYAPKAVESLLYIVALGYFVLIARTVAKIGSECKRDLDRDSIPLRSI
ncbi:hypothetical protein C8R45DRAFT_972089, partial [Mycena sanguinolenta]